MKNKQSNCHSNKCNIWSPAPKEAWHQDELPDCVGRNVTSISTLHASHVALRMVTLKISPCTNVTLTLGLVTLFMGDMDKGALHREDEVIAKQRN
jgi:hypothetical protein